MNTSRVEFVLHALSASPSRRRAVRLLGGAALGSALGWRGVAEAGAKKKRKKKKKTQACPPPPPPPPSLTCAETCPSACAICFMRPGAPTMCGGAQSDTECAQPCSSDNDCASPHPFCTLPLRVSRAGQPTAPVCPNHPTPAGFCTQIPACT